MVKGEGERWGGHWRGLDREKGDRQLEGIGEEKKGWKCKSKRIGDGRDVIQRP